MRAILKATGERGEAWQSPTGQWRFETVLDRYYSLISRRVNRSEIVLIPEVER